MLAAVDQFTIGTVMHKAVALLHPPNQLSRILAFVRIQIAIERMTYV